MVNSPQSKLKNALSAHAKSSTTSIASSLIKM